jgi:hypothetical protein
MSEYVSETGKALKIVRKSTRRVWSGRCYSATKLLELDAAERKLAYALLNPTEAELTDPAEWPGLTSARFRLGETISATRPDIYFGKKRCLLASMVLAPLSQAFPSEIESDSAPGAAQGATAPAVDASESRIRDLVEEGRAAIHRRLAKEGRRLAGVARVLRISWTKRSTHPIGELNPLFATRDAELLEAAIEEMRQFEMDHDAAKQRYAAGHHRTLFPSRHLRVSSRPRSARGEEETTSGLRQEEGRGGSARGRRGRVTCEGSRGSTGDARGRVVGSQRRCLDHRCSSCERSPRALLDLESRQRTETTSRVQPAPMRGLEACLPGYLRVDSWSLIWSSNDVCIFAVDPTEPAPRFGTYVYYSIQFRHVLKSDHIHHENAGVHCSANLLLPVNSEANTFAQTLDSAG